MKDKKGLSGKLRWILLSILAVGAIVLIKVTIDTRGVGGEGYVPALYASAFSLLPPVLAIALALITKEVFSSLFAGILIGALLYAGGNLELAFQTMLFHTDEVNGGMGLVPNAANETHAGILIFAATLWMLVSVMNKSGAVAAFGRFAEKHIKTRVGAQLTTILLGVMIFVDDGFNCLTVGSVMHPITDRFKISRAKLAYIIDSTAAPVCIIAPISSWAAAVSSTVPESMGINGFRMFIQIIPYNLYALVTLFMMVCLVTLQVDYGPMKRYEENARQKGDLFTVHSDRDITEIDDGGKGRISNLLLPIGVLIVSCVLGMLYTGGFFSGTQLIDAFANCDAARGLVMGSFIALMFTFVLYEAQGILSVRDYMRNIPEGLAKMSEPMIILILSWTLSGMTTLLGAGVYIHNLVASSASSMQMFLPFIIFLISVGLSFASGTSWGTFGILIPIICSVFPENETMLMISIAACLSGAVCGDHCSPISDTTILSGAGAGCDHISHVSTQLPYAMTAAMVSGAGFLISGVLGYTIGRGAALLALPAVLVLAMLILMGIKHRQNC